MIYPDKLLKINHFNHGLYPSGNPLYFITKADKSNNIDNLPDYFTIDIDLIYNTYNQDFVDSPQNISFILNDITYKNNIVINSSNTFLKSSDYDTVKNSIENCFKNSGLLNDFSVIFNYYAIGYTNIGIEAIIISLTSKTKGLVYFSTDFILNDDLSNNQTNRYEKSSGLPFPVHNNTIVTNLAIGDNVSQDVQGFEHILNIYKNDNLLTTLAKKGFDLADFDISQIVDNSISKYKPIINNYNINTIKYIEKFKLEAYQKFVDKSIDPNNNFSTIQGSSITSNFYAIKSKTDLFENYNSVKYDNIINQGTGSLTDEELYPIQNAQVNLEGDSYDTSYYNLLLTNQPKYKALNKSYEIICNQVYSIQEQGSTLNDVVAFKFYYNDNTTQSVSLNNLNLHTGESYRYINQVCFKVDHLKTLTNQDWSNVTKIDLFIENYTYQIQRDLNDSDQEIDLYNESIIYDLMTYYIDRTNETCNDTLSLNEIDYTPIVFLNSLGGFDLFEFGEVQEFKSNRKIETYTSPYTFQSNKLDDFEKIYDMSYNSSYLIKSRTLSKEEFKWLKDLVQSKEVYILKGTDLVPIIINDISYEYKINDDKGINLSFNYSRPENI